MKERINIQKLEPKAYEAMYSLEHYLGNCQLSKTHLELIKIRASQINGCAFCIDLHSKEALKQGETAQRIFLLNAWRETLLFTKEERIILAMTEEITLISEKGLSESLYLQAEETFEASYIAQIIMAIATINTWNRIAISTTKIVR